MPPEWMWPLDLALVDHFRDVENRRARPPDEEQPEQVQNEYARGM